MKIFISARPGARHNKVERLDETHYRVFVKAPPEDGEANAAVLGILAEYFRRPQSDFSLLAGHRSKNKIVGIRA